MKIAKKILKVFGSIIAVLLILVLFFYLRFRPTANPIWGVNFSADTARYMGLDPQKLFSDMLLDLHPKKIRLMAYWEDLEPQQGTYNFQETENFLNEAQDAGAKVILTIGRKQPRWPECHEPDWYKKLSSEQERAALLNFISTTVSHFKSYKAIERWQIENEPYFNYGPDCPVSSYKNMSEEVALVKSLDARPVVITDSGEKGWQVPAASQANIFGTTMYRKVYNSKWGKYQIYPLPPVWYRIRAGVLATLTRVSNTIDVELQAEPWFNGTVYSIPIEDQVKIMDVQAMRDNINYAKSTGLLEHYLWGVEWWYFMKQHGHGEFLEQAEATFKQ